MRGFTLIELMIVVAIIAILTAIALPTYQDYVLRAKIVELMYAADACKLSVAEYWQTTSGFPPDMATSGCVNQTTQYVASVDVGAGSGLITVTGATGPGALDPKAAGAIVLTPAVTATGQLNWDCKASTIPKQYLPAICR